MDAINPEIRDLWQRAVNDAGLDPADVKLVVVDDAAPPQGMPVVYLPSGAPVEGGRTPPLTGAQVVELQRAREPHRVIVFGRVESPALLGLLRWATDLARQYEANQPLWTFGWTALDAAMSRDYGGRPGSGVMHSALPSVRDANVAAAALVTATIGPQPGQFYGPFGTLLRPDLDFGGDATLAERTVILAALHLPALEAVAKSSEVASQLVADAHPDASKWWAQLTADPLVGHLQHVIPFLAPTDQELDTQKAAPAEAWRTLAAVLDRAMDYGLSLIASQGWAGPS